MPAAPDTDRVSAAITTCEVVSTHCSAAIEHAGGRVTVSPEALAPSVISWNGPSDLETMDVAAVSGELGGEDVRTCLRLLRLPVDASTSGARDGMLIRQEERLASHEECAAERTFAGQLSLAGRYVMTVQPQLTISDVEALLHSVGARVVRQIARPAVYEIGIADDLNRARRSSVVDVIRRRPEVVVLAPALVFQSAAPPTRMATQDYETSSCQRQWHLEKINALEAQALATCAAGPLAAVIDTRIRWSHPDLVDSIWQNPVESGDGAISDWDDDENGYEDDVTGWDFVDGDCDVEDATIATNGRGHGTAVAGIIAATPRDARSARGVCPDAKIMTIRAAVSWGQRDVSILPNVIAAIRYAVDNGVRVINLSLGGTCSDDSACPSADLSQLEDAIEEAGQRGVLIVAGAGNERQDIDKHPFYPASFDATNIIAVAASGCDDALWVHSGYGRDHVHLAAPGIDIYSTYDSYDKPCSHFAPTGTSFAAAVVSGAALAILARFGPLRPEQVRSHLMRTADKIDALRRKVQSGGRLNVFRALCECPVALPREQCPICPAPPELGGSSVRTRRSTSSSAQN